MSRKKFICINPSTIDISEPNSRVFIFFYKKAILGILLREKLIDDMQYKRCTDMLAEQYSEAGYDITEI